MTDPEIPEQETPDPPKTTIRQLQDQYLTDLDKSNGDQDTQCQYLVENQTPKGLHRPLILDDFTGQTLEALKGTVRDLSRLPRDNYPFDILAYDPILEAFVPVGDQLSGLSRCAVLRLVPPNGTPKH